MTAVFMSEENAGIVLLAAGVRVLARPLILALWLATLRYIWDTPTRQWEVQS